MSRNTIHPASLLVGVLVLAVVCAFYWGKYSAPQVFDGSIEDLLRTIDKLTKKGDYYAAIHLVENVNVDVLFQNSFEPEAGTSNHILPFFLAYAEETMIVPGVPVDLETQLLTQKQYREIPGTGDDIPFKDHRLRNRWITAASELARDFNSLVYRTTDVKQQSSDGT